MNSQPSSRPPARVVTFYSYKGGVGRTMSVANVASWLVNEAHKRVFLIDFDLEAPGLSYYAKDTPLAEFLPHKGLVELLTFYRMEAELPDLADYVIRDSPRLGGGSLMMLTAGRDDKREYATSLAQLDWGLLYESGYGFEFMEYLRKRILEDFTPDIVLIDSRTGLHGIGSIAAQHLPDLVVLPFNLSRQSIDGTRAVMTGIESNPYRSETNREIATLLIASPVYDPDSETAQNAIRRAEQEFGRRIDFQIPYSSAAAYEERWWPLDDREAPGTLLRAYAEIGRRLLELAEPPVESRTAALDTSPEAQVARLFEVEGYTVELGRDGPIHAIATRDLFPTQERVAIQVNANRKSPPMQELTAFLDAHPEIDRAIVVFAKPPTPERKRAAKRDPRLVVTSIEALLQRLLPFRPYLERLVADFEQDPLHDWYEPLNLRETPGGQLVSSDDYIERWLVDPDAPLLTVLGDFGAGKTSLCRRLAARLGRARLAEIDAGQAWVGKVPVLINLRNYAKALDLRSLVSDLLADPRAFGGGRRDGFLLLNDEGRLLILLDGFDEMGTHTDERTALDNLRELLQLVGPRSKVLLTCATGYLRSPGPADAVFADAGSVSVQLEPLSDEQVAAIVRRRVDNPERALELIHETKGLADQANRPFVLDKILQADWLRETLTIDEQQGSGREADAYRNLASVAQEQRAFDAAEQLYRKSLALHEHGDEPGAAPTYRDLGTVAQARRDFDAAERWYRRSLAIDEKHGNEQGAAITYHQLGMVAQERRDFAAAERWYRRSLIIEEKHGDEQEAAAIYHQLGAVAGEQHDFDAAERWYRKSLAINEKHGDEDRAATTYHNLAVGAQEQHDFDAAERWYRQSLAISEKRGNEHGTAITLSQLGTLATAQGNFERAMNLHIRAAKLFAKTHAPHEFGIVSRNVLDCFDEAPDAIKPSIRQAWEAAGFPWPPA